MPLPPEAVYSSQEELHSAIQSWAAQHRYAFGIGRSKKISSGFRTKVLYNCDRYGPPPPVNQPQSLSQARKRKTSSRKTGCQFSVVAIEQLDGKWELRHRPGTENCPHNHPPSQSINSHPVHRKLTATNISQARSLHNTGKSRSIRCL
ncbi:hypothetical protein K3495_g14774 [Podosphaera aphanis]|nr:hypothetical protein K3495_g14774 [Podosphaera aphanis]